MARSYMALAMKAMKKRAVRAGVAKEPPIMRKARIPPMAAYSTSTTALA